MLVGAFSLLPCNFKEGAECPSTWLSPFLKGGAEVWAFLRVLPSPGELLLFKEGKVVPSGAAPRKVR